MLQISEIVYDPNQKVKVVLLAYPQQKDSGPFIELVEPAGVPSPIDNIIKQRNHLYHYCVEVKDLEQKLQEKSNQKDIQKRLF